MIRGFLWMAATLARAALDEAAEGPFSWRDLLNGVAGAIGFFVLMFTGMVIARAIE